MRMENSQRNSLSLNDFEDKCRICLKKYGDMTDILASGISNTVMEVINIKINCNDELPKYICHECVKQLKEFYKFQSLAKQSDNYLRALLLAEKCFNHETENNILERSFKKNKFHKTYVRKRINCKYYDKMYLIQVRKGTKDSDSQNEICIKDLDSESDNVELTDFCRSLIKSRLNDHDYPVQQVEKHLCIGPTENVTGESSCNNVFKVDWFIYQCNECKESFKSKDCLNEHLRLLHNSETSMTLFSYKCMVCAESIDDKNLFLDHLRTHKTEGFIFSKVDVNGHCITATEFDKELLEAPKSCDNSVIKNRVFKVNTSCYKCFLCQKLEPAESIKEHLKVCSTELEEEIASHVKFTCPACFTSWIDDCKNFKEHLLSHKENNVFFVKVNNLGKSVDLTVEDFMFTPFEKALEVLRLDEDESSVCRSSKITKMRGLFSCQICDFDATSSNSLTQHYLEIHGSERSISCVCPVCCEHFQFFDFREMSKFQCHMINHKGEGVQFLKINSNGTIANDGPDSSGLFADINDFFIGKVQCPELEFITNVCVPVAFVEKTKDCASEECFNTRKNIAARLKDLTKKEKKCNRRYICEKCGRECFGKGNYKRHFLTHGKDNETALQKRPKCSVCDKTFSNRTVLSEHRKHHLEEVDSPDSPRTICEICGRRLSNNASLAKHRRLHTSGGENELLKCKICSRSFRRESALNRHLSAHLNPNYFECAECKLPLPSLASLERHKLGHRSSANTHDCKVCKISFLTKDRLTAHEIHTGHHQNRKRFECNVCHERFFIGREFTKHIKLHPKYKMSECALCGKRLSTMQSLMLHLDRHFESNSILCPHCGKQCFEERNYRRHLLTHKGVKPFVCDVEGCDKSFYTYFEIKRHKKYHNNTRDFNCPYCPKSFHEANHLKVHIRTHTGERPYTCPHCSKSFVTRTRCKQHISLIHQGVGYDLIQSTISKKVAVFEALETAA